MDTRYARIRTWEEMEKEFGVDEWGDINCEYSFVRRMEHLCNTVVELHTDEYGNYYCYDEKNDVHWDISDDMIKEWCD